MNKVTPNFRVLFVCTGNTCRSPMAEVLFRRAVEDSPVPIEVSSAGLFARSGAPATEYGAAVAARAGLDLTRHAAKQVENALLDSSDLILVMEPSAIEIIRQRSPGAAERSWVIDGFGTDGKGEGILDPYGGSVESYEECFHRIEEQILRIAPLVQERAARRAEADSKSRERSGG